MKQEKYILGEIKNILKDKSKINSGFAEVYYALFSDNFNFSYADPDWINQDKLFIYDAAIVDAFKELTNYNLKYFENLPLSVVAGTCLGAKKINNYILEENKKAKILTYDNYLVCDYDKLLTGDFLSGAYYIKDNLLDNLIVIAVKLDDNKTSSVINIYEECGFDVTEVKNCKGKNISEAVNSAKKSKKASLIIVQNNEIDRKFDKIEEFDFKGELKNRTNLIYKKWLIEYDKEINERHEFVLGVINYLKSPKLMIDLENIQFNLDVNYENTITASSEKIFDIVKSKSKYISVLDLKNDRLASCIAIGLSIASIKPSVKIRKFSEVCDLVILANKNKFPVNFILENADEEVYVKNLNVFIPSDMNEVIGSWSCALKANKTSLMVLSNKETTLVKNTNIKYVKYGAYMIKKENENLSAVIVSSGEDLKLALGVAGLLEKEEIYVRVVTMPCANLLLKQVKYIKELLPNRVKTFVLDKNLSVINSKVASNNDTLLSSNLGLDKVKEKIKEEINL